MKIVGDILICKNIARSDRGADLTAIDVEFREDRNPLMIFRRGPHSEPFKNLFCNLSRKCIDSYTEFWHQINLAQIA